MNQPLLSDVDKSQALEQSESAIAQKTAVFKFGLKGNILIKTNHRLNGTG